MVEFYGECRALYHSVFPRDEQLFVDRLFATYFPRDVRVSLKQGHVASMLFSIPYPIQTKSGSICARYLYGVATLPEWRGEGLASGLLSAEIESGVPLFLRAATPTLEPFYKRQGFVPFSPVRSFHGEARGAELPFVFLDPAQYAAERVKFLPDEYAAPALPFLKLTFLSGGAILLPGRCMTLYEKDGDTVYFKEWLGDVSFAPGATAFLGAVQYTARTYAESGTTFGMGIGVPQKTAFLPALD